MKRLWSDAKYRQMQLDKIGARRALRADRSAAGSAAAVNDTHTCNDAPSGGDVPAAAAAVVPAQLGPVATASAAAGVATHGEDDAVGTAGDVAETSSSNDDTARVLTTSVVLTDTTSAGFRMQVVKQEAIETVEADDMADPVMAWGDTIIDFGEAISTT